MRELVARNGLEIDAVRQLHLHRHERPRRRVPGGRCAAHGLRPRAAALRAGDRRPGLAPRIIRVLAHYYAPADHAAQHVYLGEARSLRADLDAAQ